MGGRDGGLLGVVVLGGGVGGSISNADTGGWCWEQSAPSELELGQEGHPPSEMWHQIEGGRDWGQG
jgi:hypothetical protein